MSAHTSEASSANVTVSENGRKNWRDEPADEAERQEDGDGRQGRRGDRAGHLAWPAGDRRQPVFAHGSMAIDVLEDDDGVIDDPADGYREAPQGHDVQADPGDLHDDECRQHRQRDADRGDQRRAQAEQEQEDRDDGEEGTQAALPEQAVLRLQMNVERSWTTATVSVSVWRAPASSGLLRRPRRPARYSRRSVLVTVSVSAGLPLVLA